MSDTKKIIEEKVQKEINNNTLDNAHGINKGNIQNFLIEPQLEEYTSTSDSEVKYNVWTVLKEIPDEENGYTIFFDKEDEIFGLGFYDADGQLLYLGHYGSFIKTLNSM